MIVVFCAIFSCVDRGGLAAEDLPYATSTPAFFEGAVGQAISVDFSYDKAKALIDLFKDRGDKFAAVAERMNRFVMPLNVPSKEEQELLRLANDAIATGECNQALKYARMCATKYPQSEYAWMCLGKIEFFAKKYSQAEAHLKKAHEIAPHNTLAVQMLASVYSGQKRKAKAKQALLDCLKLDPEDRDAKVKLECYENLDKMKRPIPAEDLHLLRSGSE